MDDDDALPSGLGPALVARVKKGSKPKPQSKAKALVRVKTKAPSNPGSVFAPASLIACGGVIGKSSSDLVLRNGAPKKHPLLFVV